MSECSRVQHSREGDDWEEHSGLLFILMHMLHIVALINQSKQLVVEVNMLDAGELGMGKDLYDFDKSQ